MTSNATSAVNFPFPERKRIRAWVIREYLDNAGRRQVVCFSSGNAAQQLRVAGLDVVEVGPCGVLQSERWWTPAQIARVWPDRFDATSGHLPLTLMLDLAREYQQRLQTQVGPSAIHYIPTGSGETILCLRWAFPLTRFLPLYNVGPGTEWNAKAPLNGLVGLT